MRCFAAIELPREVVDLAGRVQRALVAADASWATEKWVAPENLHVTVAFWRDLREADVGRIADTLCDAHVPPFALTAPQFVVKPRADAATMAWLTYTDESGQADVLARTLGSVPVGAAVAAGTRERPFVAHVTIVRARRPHPMTSAACKAANAVLRGAGNATVSVPSVTLFSSTLTSSGPRYQRLQCVDLGPS